MGARQSKRSVDITTTPKKGDGEIVTEGEGKLEKIGDADVKITTNGALPYNTDVEVGEKEENAKDTSAEKEAENEEVKENGVSETEEPKTPDVESVADVINESSDKSPESPGESKTEDTPETKKIKEKNKKKKWSFRSISFAKKDKSKPSKDDKNGDVKEVAEKSAEEIATSPSIESPKGEEPTTIPEATTNEEASAEDSTKPAETPKVTEEPQTPAEEPKAEEPKTDTVVEPKVLEPVVEKPNESAPSLEKDDIPPTSEEPKPVDESKPVEPPTPVVVDDIKEVRTEEVPPPLPSSNPPSPVTVFAESTKADALTADQVPVEKLESDPVAAPVVETILEPLIVQSVVEATPQAAPSSPVFDSEVELTSVVQESTINAANIPLPTTELIDSTISVPKDFETEKTELENKEPAAVTAPLQLAEKSTEAEVVGDAPQASLDIAAVLTETLSEAPKLPETPTAIVLTAITTEEPKPTNETLTGPSEDLKDLTTIESSNTEASTDSSKTPEIPVEPENSEVPEPTPATAIESSNTEISKDASKTPEIHTESPNSEVLVEPLPEIPTSLTELPKSSEISQIIEKSSEAPLETPNSEASLLPLVSSGISLEQPSEELTTSDSSLIPEQSSEIPIDQSLISPELTKPDTVPTDGLSESAEVPVVCPKLSDSVTEPNVLPPSEALSSSPPLSSINSETTVLVSEASSGSLPAAIVPSPEPTLSQTELSTSITEQLPEPVVNADSLPDISTESLPSLPDPLSENLAEPMSLPPVDSVPEPIATDSLTECPASEISPSSPVLTNGTSIGLPSPTDEVSAQLVKEGPLKQVPTEVSKDCEVQDAGNITSDTPAEVAKVEE